MGSRSLLYHRRRHALDSTAILWLKKKAGTNALGDLFSLYFERILAIQQTENMQNSIFLLNYKVLPTVREGTIVTLKAKDAFAIAKEKLRRHDPLA